MKILKIENNKIKTETPTTDEIIEAIHKLAEKNGSTDGRIDIELIGDNLLACGHSVANRNITPGYYAVLYLIDCAETIGDYYAYTNPGYLKFWFSVIIPTSAIDRRKFYEYLTT